ncbi:hypothetical protein BGZ95_004653, partial [Linnemannia exigua]
IHASNATHVNHRPKGQLPLPPSRKVAIVTGIKTIIVAQHTDWGILTFENKDIHAVIHKNLHGADATHIDFLPFPDLEQNIRNDVQFLRNHELIPKSIDIHVYVYDIACGRLVPVDSE